MGEEFLDVAWQLQGLRRIDCGRDLRGVDKGGVVMAPFCPYCKLSMAPLDDALCSKVARDWKTMDGTVEAWWCSDTRCRDLVEYTRLEKGRRERVGGVLVMLDEWDCSCGKAFGVLHVGDDGTLKPMCWNCLEAMGG